MIGRYSLTLLLGALIGGHLLLTNITTTRWGEQFLPHDIAQTLPLSDTFSYTQSLEANYSWINGILLDVADPSPDSHLNLTFGHDNTQPNIAVSLADAFDTGELYVPLPDPLYVGRGNSVQFTVAHLSGPPANLRFQINNRERPRGELTRFNTQTNLTQPHNGNIALRIQYRATLAEQTGLTTTRYMLLAVAAVLAWVLYWRFQPIPTFLPPLSWQRLDFYIMAIVAVLVSAIYFQQLAPTLTHLPLTHDFAKDTLYLNSATQSIKSGAIPYWHHATCGGQPLLGNPETNIVGLGTFISLFTGPVIGLKLMLILEAGLMAAGGYVLGRSFGLSYAGAIVPALALPLSGFAVNRVFLGHTNFLGGLAIMPWALAAYLKIFQRRRWLLITALLLSLMLFRGDTHILAYTLILLILWSLWLALRSRNFNPLKAIYIVVTLLTLFSLPKLLPMLASAEHFNADLPQFFIPLLSREIFDDVLLNDSEELPALSLVYGDYESWENIGLHVGLLAVALSLIGLAAAPRPAALLIGGTIAVFLVLGEGTVYNEYLRHLPLVGSVLRLPSRLLIMAILAGSLSAGFFIDALFKHRSILGPAAALLILGFLFDDMSSYARELLGRTEFIPPSQNQSSIDPQTKAYNQLDPEQHSITLVANGAVVPGLCLDFNQSPPFNTDIETSLVTDAQGNPISSNLQPNTLTITDPPQSTKLFVRVVDSPLLTIDGGYRLPLNDDKVLPVVATDPNQPLKLSYLNRSFWPGSLLALGTLTAFLTVPRRRLDPT